MRGPGGSRCRERTAKDKTPKANRTRACSPIASAAFTHHCSDLPLATGCRRCLLSLLLRQGALLPCVVARQQRQQIMTQAGAVQPRHHDSGCPMLVGAAPSQRPPRSYPCRSSRPADLAPATPSCSTVPALLLLLLSLMPPVYSTTSHGGVHCVAAPNSEGDLLEAAIQPPADPSLVSPLSLCCVHAEVQAATKLVSKS